MTSLWGEVISALVALLRHGSPDAPGLTADVVKLDTLTKVPGSPKATQPTAAERAEVSR